MLKTRLIPCILLKNGLIVRSEQFQYHQNLGDPIHQVKRFTDWQVDELIYLDITRDGEHDLRRDDHKVKSLRNILDILSAVSKACFVPLAFGGGIRTLDDIAQRLRRGADKVVINTAALKEPSFLREAARVFGRQCLVVSIDVKRHDDGRYEVVADCGRAPTGREPVAWAQEAQRQGAGEIFLNSIDRDGMAQGYDLALVHSVAEAVDIPVIACGGAGTFDHFVQGVVEGQADAVAAANLFHFTEHSYPRAKKHMKAAALNVRLVEFGAAPGHSQPLVAVFPHG
ncbi:MAG: imidazole glycerol phosphate synthase subunit HisF [Candidatus Omnitrophica bacterium]|nr:imidazole glycerol phosphate synthase subunit HisF [Candidatus Omnitrophota bacterium]